ncbi:protein furry isoform X4 [Lutzomyia longipalpis]|uniref:protein furry isoform X4 n=1 Tax=Lutzomyia longipalpis TaxID=7200 RepID=UPI0024833C4A|nr:protein furry isoform X4 [Lutzomyia longipalpis]
MQCGLLYCLRAKTISIWHKNQQHVVENGSNGGNVENLSGSICLGSGDVATGGTNVRHSANFSPFGAISRPLDRGHKHASHGNLSPQENALISGGSGPYSSTYGDEQSVAMAAVGGNEVDGTKVAMALTTTSTRSTLLPWGQHTRSTIAASGSGSASAADVASSSSGSADASLRPGEIVMRSLFADFTQQAEKKIESVMLEGSEKNLSKLLQRGEDSQFDQLLSALGSVAEHCLPSLLNTLLAWHKRQLSDAEIKNDLKRMEKMKSSMDIELQLQRRESAVEFIFCLALIEILKQLPFHPGHEDIIKNIENLAFKHFKYREGLQTNPNAHNIHMIADLNAEVVGVLAQSRFSSVRKRFMSELKELRAKEPSPHTTQSIISLLMGMKFFRVKMVPIEEFEASFQFMHECAQYFLEIKDKDIKHALAGLFVEILVPVAAAVKNEVNVPCVKNFVDLLYSQTLDACTKSKHRLALFPLVTCLLCVAQKTFFLNNWHYFLAMCLSNLKNRDAKMSRVALESLYRLLWVYMIRIKCESNSATHSRLQSIVNSLFPRGSKSVVPRDTPLNIFVKIIQFIAAERLDFAMREIVFELLLVGRSIKVITTPERMSIGLRAFLVVADSLQQKDGEPPMPRTVGVLPSGNTLRVKKTYLNKMLTEDTARTIGMSNYFPHVRRVFVDMLRALDVHCGRPLMMTNTQNVNKEPDELLTDERRPKIDLFRTCVAAIPRLIPDNMTGHELVDLLSRLTVHIDDELRGLAYQSLQTLMIDFPDWRQDVIHGFTQFLARDVADVFPQFVDNGLRMLVMFLNTWRNAVASNTLGNPTNAISTSKISTSYSTNTVKEAPGFVQQQHQQQQQQQQNAASTTTSNSSGNSSVNSSGVSSITQQSTATVVDVARKSNSMEQPLGTTFHLVEGLALIVLCNSRPQPRKLAVHIMKEVKNLKKALGLPETEPPLIDVIDKCCPSLMDKCLPMLPQAERAAMLAANVIDLQWIADRTSGIWSIGHTEDVTKASTLTLNLSQSSSAASQQFDPWVVLLFGFMERNRVLQQCPSVVAQAWPVCYQRVTGLYSVIDPTPVSDNRASLLRSSAPPKKNPLENQRDSLAHLWKNQVAMAMRVVPPIPSVAVRCASPDLSLSLHEHSDSRSLSDSLDNIPSNVFGPEGMITRFTLPLSYGRKDFRNKRQGSSPDSLTADRSDKSGSAASTSPVALYKLVVPLLRCEVTDVRDAAVNALGMINPDALKDLMDELVIYIREAIDRKQENMRRRRRRDALRLQLVRVLEKIADNGTYGVSPWVLERESMSLHPTFVEYIDGARLYLEAEIDKENTSIRDVKTHFCDFIRKLIKNFPLEACGTLLSRDLKRNLFNLFASWSGEFAKPLGISHNTASSGSSAEEEKLQFSALQAMSVLLCRGFCFNTQYLAEEGLIYPWLDMLLESKDEKIYQLAKDTVVLLFESNPDMGQLLEWAIDRCYTALPRQADACFLALAAIFSAREYPCDHYTSVINVTLLMTGCPRIAVHSTAIQLLQVLDKRFFGTVGPLHPENEKDEERLGTLDVLLTNAYCRSQMFLSKQMAQLRPELTMPMFSEITHRFQTARAEVRVSLLQCLLPWLENVELVAASVPPATPLSYIMYYPDTGNKGRREGSGSTEATEMILNNLFYITVKFADSHSRDIEELWGTLCQFWQNNLKVILRYLVIMSGMAPTELLPYAKRVALYLARTCPNRLLDELMSELQIVETLNCLIERTETPPFYRLTSMRKASSHSDGPATGANDARLQELAVEKGTIHTKRHSGEDPIKTGTCKSDSGLRSFSTGYRPPRGSDKIRAASGPSILPRPEDVITNEPELTQEEGFELRSNGAPVAPHPLPMPEYGGYFAPLTEFLPDMSLPISGFHRCNVAVMLLTDIVVDGIPGIDWTLHIPLMMHILFLGIDHTRPIVRDHCKQLLLNLLVVLAEHSDHLSVARILLNSETLRLGLGITVPTLPVIQHNFTEPDQEFDSYLFGPIVPAAVGTQAALTGGTAPPENYEVPLIVTEENAPPQPGPSMPTAHVIKSLILFLSRGSPQPLWNYEDITAKLWSIKSAEQLTCFLHHILKVFSDSYPLARISERWSQTALQLGLSCSSRHYAGRSLQVFRALNVPINSRMLSDILSRLVETVAEQGEDMQGYVTELLLTLEAAVDSLDSDFRPLDVMKDIFKSTPNLNNKDGTNTAAGKKSPSGVPGSPLTANFSANQGHTRSTSYSVSYCTRKTTSSPNDKQVELRNRAAGLEIERSGGKFGSSLSRSRSAQSLKHLGDTGTQDDKMTILAQLFWLAVSLLESDYEHEFLLALRLLSRVLHRLPLDRPDARDKVEKLQTQLKWTGYPGVHALLLKGCTHSPTYEQTISVLSQFAPLLSLPVCDPTQSCAFPLNVIALLPYMLLHYEDANDVCVRSAENIAQVSSELGSKLENLGTVMILYSRKTFSKESFQWTKCVVKYLYDTYAHMGLHMLAFLIEVLEKGWQQVQLQVLSVLHCMLHYIDLSSAQAQPISADLLRVVAKYLDSAHWKEAMKILKLVVTRSSSLQVVPQGPPEINSSPFFMHSSYSDSEVFYKKELAGRTMDFTFDVSQTPLIGRRILLKSESDAPMGGGGAQGSAQQKNGHQNQGFLAHAGTPNSPRRSASLSPADTIPLSGWKRPWMSQGRVRECLVNLLTTCGQRVGLPKSPSSLTLLSGSVQTVQTVIFSQSSDLMERQSSAASSTDETSGPQQDLSGGSRRDDGQPDFGVFKDFDFLEYESESIEGESTDNFNWGVRRRPLSEGDSEPLTGSKPHSLVEESLSEKTPLPRRKRHQADDSSDEEVESESPLDEDQRPLFTKPFLTGPPTSLSLREQRHRRDSVSRSDTSGSSAGDLGDITPCNASPHLPGLISFRAPIRDDGEEAWRQQMQALLVNQPSGHAPELLQQLYQLVRELTTKTIIISKESVRFFTGIGVPLGGRISAMMELLASKGEPPRVWHHQGIVTTPRLFETLRFGVLEVQEHLETFFDRKDHVLECLDSVKTSCKLALFSDIDLQSDAAGASGFAFDPATAEILIDLGRGLYKLMFQLLLLIESDNKILLSIVQNLRQNEKMHDFSKTLTTIRSSLLGCVDDTEMDSLDTSTSTEGENTPTPSPSVPMTNAEFENVVVELIENQRWSAVLAHVRQHRQLTATAAPTSPCGDATLKLFYTETPSVPDDVTFIINIYSQRLTKERQDVYIISRTENELTDTYTILMENLYHVSSALNAMELTLKNSSSGSSLGGGGGGGVAATVGASASTPAFGGSSKDTVDIITTL